MSLVIVYLVNYVLLLLNFISGTYARNDKGPSCEVRWFLFMLVVDDFVITVNITNECILLT